MLLLTGATGLVGSALLRRLVGRGRRRSVAWSATRGGWGAERVRVQIALGDLADPPSFRNALRGVDTVVHLAATIRDQPRRLDRGAQRDRHLAAGPGGRARRAFERFVFFSAAGRLARTTGRASCGPRRWRSEAVRSSRPAAHGLRPLDRLRARRPVPDDARAPVAAAGHAGQRPRAGREFQPIWAEDVADLRDAPRWSATAARRATSWPARTTLSHTDLVELALRVLRPPAPAGARADADRQPRAACARGADEVQGPRDVGRGRADGGLDARRSTGRPTPRRWASARRRWPRCSGSASRRSGAGRELGPVAPTACAASSWVASASSAPSWAGWPTSCTESGVAGRPRARTAGS